MGLCFTDPQEKAKFDALVNAVGERSAYEDFFENNRVRTPDEVRYKLERRAWPELFRVEQVTGEEKVDRSTKQFQRDFFDFVRSVNQKDSVEAVQAISNRLKIPYRIVTLAEAKNIVGRKTIRGGGFYTAGTVYLVEGMYNSDTVFHEFAHPIVKALAEYNPTVFNGLLEEVPAEFADQIRAEYAEDYEGAVDEMKQEIIVQYLEQMNRDEVKDPKTLGGKIIFHLKQLLRKFFGKKINLDKLSVDTNLKDFLGMLNYGKEFNFEREFLTEDEFVYLQKEYYKITDQINQETVQEAQELLEGMYSMVNNQLYTIEREVGTSFYVRDMLLNKEDRKSELEVMQKVLRSIIAGQAKIKDSIRNNELDGIEVQLVNDLNRFIHQITNIKALVKRLTPAVEELSQLDIKDEAMLNKIFTVAEYLDNYNEFLKRATKTKYLMWGSEDHTMPVHNEIIALQNQVDTLLRKANEVRGNIAVELLYDHITDKTERASEFYETKLAILKERGNTELYNRLYAEYHGLTPEQEQRWQKLNEKYKRTEIQDDAEGIEYRTLSEQKLTGLTLTKDELKHIIATGAGVGNKTGAFINRMYESYTLNQDKATGGFYSYIERHMKKINAMSNARQVELLKDNKLHDLLKAAGYGALRRNFSSSDLGRKMGAIHDIAIYDPSTGEFKFGQEWRFKSNFINYDAAFRMAKVRLKNAQKKANFTQNEADIQEMLQAEEDMFFLKKNYFYQDYVPEFYENEALLYKDEIGRKARRALYEIYDEINELGDELQVLADSELASAKAEKFRELLRLRSLYVNGKKKTGEALAIAERLQEYQKGRLEFFQSTYNDDVFNAAYKNAVEDAQNTAKGNDKTFDPVKHGELFELEMEEWFKAHTQVSLEDSYYERITTLVSRRSQLLKPMDKLNDDIKKELQQTDDVDMDAEYEKIKEVIRPTRDDAGEYNGTELSAKEQIAVRDAHQNIEKVRKALYTVNGITGEEFDEYMRLVNKLRKHGHRSFTEDERDAFESFQGRLDGKLAEYGLTKDEIDEIAQIDAELQGMSTPIYTTHYFDVWQEALRENEDFRDMFVKFKKEWSGMDIGVDYEITQQDIEDLLLSENFDAHLKNALEIDSDFSTWFVNNHYEAERHETYDAKYDERTGDEISPKRKKVAKVYRSTNAWRFSTPLNSDFFKTYELLDADGNGIGLMQDNKGRYRIPNINYQNRQVKLEHTTERVERDFVVKKEDHPEGVTINGTHYMPGELVLRNFNVKKEWLPMDYRPGEQYSAIDAEYVDPTYKDMFENNRDLFNLHQHLMNWHLDNQYNTSPEARLDIVYPKLRMEGGESLKRRGYWRRKWNRTIEAVGRKAADDAERDLYQGAKALYTGHEIDRLEIFNSRPVSGVYDLDFVEVSTDILWSAQEYQHSIQEHRVFNELNAFGKTIEWAMTEWNPFTQQMKELDAYMTQADKQKIVGSRMKAINAIIDKHFQGVQSVIDGNPFGGSKRMFAGLDPTVKVVEDAGNVSIHKARENMLRWIMKESSRKWFIWNIIALLGNYSSAEVQTFYKVIDNLLTGRNFNFADWTVGHYKATRTLTQYSLRTFSTKNKSVQMQLMDILDASPDKYQRSQSDAGGRTLLQDIARGRPGFALRTASTHEVNYSTMYAFMNNRKFRFKMEDGSGSNKWFGWIYGGKTTLDKQVHLVDGRIETKPGVPEEYSIKYDANGNVIFGREIERLIDHNRGFIHKIHGMAGKNIDNEWMSRHWLGKTAGFLFKFLPGMVSDKYQFKVRSRDGKKQLIRGKQIERRFDWLTEESEYGVYIDAIRFARSTAMLPKGKWTFDMKQLSGLVQTLLAYLLSQALVALLYNLPFYPSDRRIKKGTGATRLKDFGIYDDKYRSEDFKSWFKDMAPPPDLPWVSKEQSQRGFGFNGWNYLMAFTAVALNRIERENNTTAPVSMLTLGYQQSMMQFATYGGTYKDLYDIGATLIQVNSGGYDELTEDYGLRLSGKDPAKIGKPSGPYIFQDAEWLKKHKDVPVVGKYIDSKLPHLVAKYRGFTGWMIDPAWSFTEQVQFNIGTPGKRPWDWNPFLEAPNEVEPLPLEIIEDKEWRENLESRYRWLRSDTTGR